MASDPITLLVVDDHPVVRDGLRGMFTTAPGFDVLGEATLSARACEVLALVAKGTPKREIAAELFISEATAKTHLTHIYGKLGVTDRAAAVATAYERDILG